jgi:uncharacterized protein (DUF3084 family)
VSDELASFTTRINEYECYISSLSSCASDIAYLESLKSEVSSNEASVGRREQQVERREQVVQQRVDEAETMRRTTVSENKANRDERARLMMMERDIDAMQARLTAREAAVMEREQKLQEYLCPFDEGEADEASKLMDANDIMLTPAKVDNEERAQPGRATPHQLRFDGEAL